MLYPKSKEPSLTPELFRNPTCEYRATPFWAWNCKLDKQTLVEQIGQLKQMGMGGFHMHSRTGMGTPYLSDEFMGMVKTCVDEAERQDMLAWLYDEDRWPSGSAGGLVTRDPKYRARQLRFTMRQMDTAASLAQAVETGAAWMVACFDVTLDKEGCLDGYVSVSPDAPAQGTRWYVYTETNELNPWYNGQTYVDTLDRDAIAKFVHVTHDAYKAAVGEEFGKRVPAIFTDEPQFTQKQTLAFAHSTDDVVLPWTVTFPQSFEQQYGYDIVQKLPELLWDLPDGEVSLPRYHYHNHIAERFASAFADTCGDWCAQNGIMLTGHMMEEPTLRSQTHALGDAMRSYRAFQLPGIDMLCDWVEFTTAKQAQSAVRQYGREGMLSELYGVTNWDFDFRGHKFQGDWQAALGVTVRVPHLTWMSMKGEAKRDYPASIGYQSPWYDQYRYVEDHFARVNTALTRGKAIADVAVVHPVESYWLHWGPNQNTNAIRTQMDNAFQDLTHWLLLGQVDFDFLCESLLPEQCAAGGNPLKVGEMAYKTVLVPNCETLRRTTFERLYAFQKAGGNLIFVGQCPRMLDAVETDEVHALYDASVCIPFDRNVLLDTLAPVKAIDIRNGDGSRNDNILYQLRQDGDVRWLFLANGVKPVEKDVTQPQELHLTIRGLYTPVLYDTITGDIRPVSYRQEDGNTLLTLTRYLHDSFLFRLDPTGADSLDIPEVQKERIGGDVILDRVRYERAEPNVVLLDVAEYALDGEAWQPREEILRLDNACRARLGYPPHQGAVVQPWVLEAETPSHTLALRFCFDSELEADPHLALEDADKTEIWLNGESVTAAPDGWFTDKSIQTVPLPRLKKGQNELVLKLPFGRTTNTEWCYVLGDFNVRLEGCSKTIIAPTGEIGFSSITGQGLPFYGGNLTYHVELETPACDLSIRVPHYRGSLVRASLDGKELGVIAYAPCEVVAQDVSAGKHTLSLTVYGNRINSFGALHNADRSIVWYGPDAWRSTGDAWCYEYRLREMGILASPVLTYYKK